MADGPHVLVTGGAGYIGSHAVLALLAAGYRVTVIDDLSTGWRAAVPETARFVEGRIQDRDLVRRLLGEAPVDGVLHFAGSIQVGESVTNPLKYYENNTAASRSLLEDCIAAGVRTLIFSSTAAVYGIPQSLPVDEDAAKEPINPYGWSKLMTERMIHDAAAAHGLRYGILRYFNVAGADPDGRAGQATPNATHLIKVAVETLTGVRQGIDVFGDDYPTRDGSGVRDYIHVTDLAEAHVALLKHLEAGGEPATLNCGYGTGYSVLEVLAALERVAGRAVAHTIGPRRAGDPAELVADNGRIRAVLDWTPRYDDLDTILRTALAWERKLREQSADDA